MIPKGVEHLNQFVFGGEYCLVRIPMMPKGVEHAGEVLMAAPTTEVGIAKYEERGDWHVHNRAELDYKNGLIGEPKKNVFVGEGGRG
jgi:hypothetical protein